LVQHDVIRVIIGISVRIDMKTVDPATNLNRRAEGWFDGRAGLRSGLDFTFVVVIIFTLLDASIQMSFLVPSVL
jgi:hypothetical protein